MTGTNNWDAIVGCIMASHMSTERKTELINFIRMWEERSIIYDD